MGYEQNNNERWVRKARLDKERFENDEDQENDEDDEESEAADSHDNSMNSLTNQLAVLATAMHRFCS